ncbi:XTP/dITP diphosphatase [Companilactobacillus sp.]|jgi:XTP/dITP diphosphohydrolase|uniref:XTP/dITP diphosphatase n=1 Tax=Companilactobacillus sp. TaxID=2767905 RepID=UPI0025C5D2F3|nr:XTP/dITP diphosphatase [Companilactobacillus sp.]MCH4010310.1 XTP/dITP diphosphatase [Companilactobacillus sp.]MCH4052014.1 XTP/dITP diphosphatase [Companilactobacillus sp.]MCH4078252.1 XTP/dITP diphosphatase [Companilactobacillus sp.]MCH4126828.1 XTP/dITP diphosphatase [Companilactobacillus sp.]MCH4132667.1 XTP/dITP diphosphatase [Companilactobacillus sp.]
MQEIIIATKNPNKAKEFQRIFDPENFVIKTLLDFPDFPEIKETGSTFEENATIKAHAVMNQFHLPTIADDSGLSVDALFGQPGVRSARYAGDHNDAANNAKLLSEIGGTPEEKRTAKFVTVLVFANPKNPKDLVVEGEVNGLIASFPKGDDGFGYDPLFYVPSEGKTMSEMTLDEKNKISHRGNAIRKLESKWQDWIVL